MRPLTVTGVARTLSVPVWSPDTERAETIAVTAFNAQLQEPGLAYTPLEIDHGEVSVPTLRTADFRVIGDELHFRNQIDADTTIGRAVVLAVRHGFLSRVSLGCRFPGNEYIRRGDTDQFQVARIEEISLTDSPLDDTTYVQIEGEAWASEKTWPTDPIEAAHLTRLLRDLGRAGEIPKPAATAVKPAVPAVPATAPVVAPLAKAWENPAVCVVVVPTSNGGKRYTTLKDYQSPQPVKRQAATAQAKSPTRQIDVRGMFPQMFGFNRQEQKNGSSHRVFDHYSGTR